MVLAPSGDQISTERPVMHALYSQLIEMYMMLYQTMMEKHNHIYKHLQLLLVQLMSLRSAFCAAHRFVVACVLITVILLD